MSQMSTREIQALFALLSYELFGKELYVEANGVAWQDVLAAANEHAITPLLYSGVNRMEGIEQSIFDSIERSAVRSTIISDRMAKIQNEVLRRLKEERINAVVLKGTSVAACYRHPEVRITGDIDILVDPADMEKCGEILQQDGFVFEDSGELHAVYRKKQAVVEVHWKVSWYPSTANGIFAQNYMDDALKNAVLQRFGQYDFPVLDTSYQLVSLLSHMERHMTASGIGLRQLCDWAVSVHQVKAEESEAVINVLEKCGLLRFAQILTKVCEKYLGLPGCGWLSSVPDELIEETISDILSVGNFQAQYENRPFASALIDPYDLEGDGKRRLVRTYFRRVERKMSNEYVWAKSRAWIPFFGVFYFGRLCLAILKGDVNGKGMLNTLRTSRAREKLLRKMCLYK